MTIQRHIASGESLDVGNGDTLYLIRMPSYWVAHVSNPLSYETRITRSNKALIEALYNVVIDERN